MTQITGRNNDIMDVSEDGLALVEAVIESAAEFHSERFGSAAYWNSTYSATGGQEVLYIQNTEGTQRLHITRMVISSSVASLWTLFKVTSATAAGGTALPYVNPSFSGVVKQNNSFGNASVTGSLSGDTLLVGSIGVALIDYSYNFGGTVILGNTDAIALTLTTTGIPQVHLEGYWDED